MNTQAMLDLIRANEESLDFDITKVFNGIINISRRGYYCGTYGCLWGNYLIKNKFNLQIPQIFYSDNSLSYNDVALYLDIPINICQYLFSEFDYIKDTWGFKFNRIYDDTCYLKTSTNERICSKEDALNRVRKYVYMKLHQKEMELDGRGCVREEVRDAGSWDLMDKVKKELITV